MDAKLDIEIFNDKSIDELIEWLKYRKRAGDTTISIDRDYSDGALDGIYIETYHYTPFVGENIDEYIKSLHEQLKTQ